jgi:hypothetical protein
LFQCPNYPTLNQEKIVNDLEFCENLETSEAQIEGGKAVSIFFSSPLLSTPFMFSISGKKPTPAGAFVAELLTKIFGPTVTIVDKPNFKFGVMSSVPSSMTTR